MKDQTCARQTKALFTRLIAEPVCTSGGWDAQTLNGAVSRPSTRSAPLCFFVCVNVSSFEEIRGRERARKKDTPGSHTVSKERGRERRQRQRDMYRESEREKER